MVRVFLTSGQSVDVPSATRAEVETSFTSGSHSEYALICKGHGTSVVAAFKLTAIVGYTIGDERAPAAESLTVQG